jgi:pimeloyl-ACP methyl ester carboxylesterase
MHMCPSLSHGHVPGAGMCGFSMGGVHACMVASLYPRPLACVPLLAPRSAAVAFCDGALRDATAWRPLAAAADEAQKVTAPPAPSQSMPQPQATHHRETTWLWGALHACRSRGISPHKRCGGLV